MQAKYLCTIQESQGRGITKPALYFKGVRVVLKISISLTATIFSVSAPLCRNNNKVRGLTAQTILKAQLHGYAYPTLGEVSSCVANVAPISTSTYYHDFPGMGRLPKYINN